MSQDSFVAVALPLMSHHEIPMSTKNDAEKAWFLQTTMLLLNCHELSIDRRSESNTRHRALMLKFHMNALGNLGYSLQQRKGTSQVLRWIAITIIVAVILFSLPSFVGAKKEPIRLCRGKGYVNSTDGLCTCISGYHGSSCQYKYCPFGPSWFSPPYSSNIRSTPYVPCSNMGYCEPLTGECQCRDGYEGRACERLACPRVGYSVNSAFKSLSNVEVFPSGEALTTSRLQVHERCWTGVRRILSDSGRHKIQGCICDYGWGGYACSHRTCPMGRDPTSPTFAYDKDATFVLQCQADGGYFSILALGSYTQAIPYDADPGYLKYALESIPNAGTVTVTMPVGGIVCGSSQVMSTYIQFDSYLGNRPPIYVTAVAGATRMWSDGDVTLNSGGNLPTLRMATMHTLTCPVCLHCKGKVYFTYGSSVSTGVNITGANAVTAVKVAILGLSDLSNAMWTNFQINVTISGQHNSLCSAGAAVTTTIALYSDYGNIPSLGMLDGSYYAGSSTFVYSTGSANLTFTTNAGNGTLYECSNQGYCNRATGTCDCFMLTKYRKVQYRAVSSDGKGNKGNRGDCGYILNQVPSCYIAGEDACGSNGYCSNTTHTCTCYDGWSGLNCGVRECPKGPAFFDEPTSSDTAHADAECSNAGMCDRSTGLCHCNPQFTGAACQIKDCVRDATTGEACSGHGSCVNMNRFFLSYGLSYGNLTDGYLNQGTSTWDAFNWYECVCSAKIAAGFFPVDVYRPSIGPSALYSGTVATSDPLPGWGNWDCSKRNCPKGDTINRRTYYHTYLYKTNNLEIQRVVCDRQRGNLNYSDYFKLQMYGGMSQRIYNHYNAAQIKFAIEYMAVIGNVTVTFPNMVFDNVSTACSSDVNKTTGGFLVQFDTEFGDLPMLQNTMSTLNVTISEFQKGNNTNLECGGSTMGYCDRSTGLCLCNRHQYSSNGTISPGAVGDCSFFSGTPESSLREGDPAVLFGIGKRSDQTFTDD
eukprot:gene33000-42696_t